MSARRRWPSLARTLLAAPVAVLVSAAVICGVPGSASATPSARSATGEPSRSMMRYTGDSSWRADVVAWTTNLVAYKSIGATVHVQHREWVCTGPFCWGGHSWQWVDRPASISISNVYTAWPVSDPRPCPPANCVPPAQPRRCATEKASSLQCMDFAVFTGPAQLNIKSVTSSAVVHTPSGDVGLGPVSDAFWF